MNVHFVILYYDYYYRSFPFYFIFSIVQCYFLFLLDAVVDNGPKCFFEHYYNLRISEKTEIKENY